MRGAVRRAVHGALLLLLLPGLLQAASAGPGAPVDRGAGAAPPDGGSGEAATGEPDHGPGSDRGDAAQSLHAAKRLVRLDAAWLLQRPPWEERLSGEGVRIGLVDTGLDAAHPDLRDVLACAHCWRDLVEGRPAPYDDHGHGTHVAGILVAQGHVQTNPLAHYWLTGARGMAPGARLIVAKAMDAQGEAPDERVAQAVRWLLDPDGDPATDDGAHVINLSLGITPVPAARDGAAGQGEEDAAEARRGGVGLATRAAVEEALSRGVAVVASSGNDGAAQTRWPADLEAVVVVGAVDRTGAVAAFSNHGPGLDLVAPGVLVSTYPLALDTRDFAQDGYAAMAGTSMSTPVVAGVATLLLEARPALRAGAGAPGSDRDSHALQHLHDLLVATAAPRGDPRSGAGLLDARAALAAAEVPPGPLWADGLAGAFVLLGLSSGAAARWARRRRWAPRAAPARTAAPLPPRSALPLTGSGGREGGAGRHRPPLSAPPTAVVRRLGPVPPETLPPSPVGATPR